MNEKKLPLPYDNQSINQSFILADSIDLFIYLFGYILLYYMDLY